MTAKKTKLNALQSARQRGKSWCETFKHEIRKIDNDLSMLSEDKTNLKQHRLNLAREKASAESMNLLDMGTDYLREAKHRLKEAQSVMPNLLAARAAVLGPTLAALDDTQLLNLLESRFTDNYDRTLITETIQARYDARGDQGGKLRHDYQKKYDQLKGQLPKAELDALENLTQAEQFSYYAELSANEIQTLLEGLSRPLTTQENIALKRYASAADKIEHGAVYNPRDGSFEGEYPVMDIREA